MNCGPETTVNCLVFTSNKKYWKVWRNFLIIKDFRFRKMRFCRSIKRAEEVPLHMPLAGIGWIGTRRAGCASHCAGRSYELECEGPATPTWGGRADRDTCREIETGAGAGQGGLLRQPGCSERCGRRADYESRPFRSPERKRGRIEKTNPLSFTKKPTR